MFQQAVDIYKTMQSHGWEFFLCFQELPTLSPRAGGIWEDPQALSEGCKRGTHSLA